MDLNSTNRALTRARKRLAHALRQAADAPSDRAKARHMRRVRNAERAFADARWTWERTAFTDA